LYYDVFVAYACGFQCFRCAVEERGDQGCVPARMDDADAEVGACVVLAMYELVCAGLLLWEVERGG
jgi:hypothetical protein